MMNDEREEREVKRNKYLSKSSIKLFDHIDRLVSTTYAVSVKLFDHV